MKIKETGQPILKTPSIASICIFLLAAYLLSLTGLHAATTICKWKDNKSGAYSISHDDSMLTHSFHAIPNLVSRGLVGTFFVNAGGPAYASGIMVWESLCSRTGIDMENHTLTHTGAATLAIADFEIGECTRILRALRAPGQSNLMLFVQPGGTAWPSGYATSILPVYYCVFDRGGVNEPGNGLATCKQAALDAITNGDWRGISFHGVGPDAEYLYFDRTFVANDYIDLCDYLVTLSNQLWVGTNMDVHKYQQEYLSASVNTLEDTSSIIRLNLASTAAFNGDTTLYDYPLTLITDVPGSWSYCKITQGGRISIKQVSSSKVKYDVIPNNGEISLVSSAIDTTPPGTPVVRDGTGVDIAVTADLDRISANWDLSADAESGVAKYWYKAGTTAGGSEILDWIDNGTATFVTTSRTNIALSRGVKYYITVKAVNGSGLESIGTSNGQTVQETAGYIKFHDDFETGTTSSWTAVTQAGANTIQVVTESPRQGTHCLKCHIADISPVKITKSNATALNSNFARFYFKLSSDFDMQVTTTNTLAKILSLMSLNDAAGVYAGKIYISKLLTGFSLFLYTRDENNGYEGIPQWPAQFKSKYNYYPVSTGTWHCVDVHTLAQGGSKGGVELWLDGTKLASWLRMSTTGKDGRHLEIGADNIPPGTSGDIYYDDITLSDSLYAPPSGASQADTTPPSAPAVVRDGTGTDISDTNSLTALSANWDFSADAESGVAKYWYAIGTSLGGTDTLGWTDNGTATAVTKTALTLTTGTTYYFSVRAENGTGLQSAASNSNGQKATENIIVPPQPGTAAKPYPNPYNFSNSGTMKFSIDGPAAGEVSIYSSSGRLVKKLTGTNTIEWDGKNESGERVKPGIYLYYTADSSNRKTGKLLIK